jgi:uncharacterized MnhB-related membrane protein
MIGLKFIPAAIVVCLIVFLTIVIVLKIIETIINKDHLDIIIQTSIYSLLWGILYYLMQIQ